MRLDRTFRALNSAAGLAGVGLIFIGECLILLVLAPFLALAWLLNLYDKHYGAVRNEWRLWFAWRPVYLGRGLDAVVWLERLERTEEGWFTLHRYPGDQSIQASWEYIDPEEG